MSLDLAPEQIADLERVSGRDRSGSAFTTASAVKPRRIRWAWQGRLAFGYLSLWSGESSLGKSTFSCSLFAAVTRGTLEGHLHGEPANVLIVASEDAREDMWVPRLIAAGADLDRIQFQNQVRGWDLRDGLKLTEQALDEGAAKVVFVDSVLEVLPEARGGENVNSPTFIRRALGPFADLFKARQVAGLMSTHPPKSKGSTFADNVIASAAFVHLTRVGLLFAWHPDDLELPDQERRRVLMRPPGGSNIGRDPGTFEFRVLAKELPIEGEMEEIPYTTALVPSDVTYRDLTRTHREEAPASTRVAEVEPLIAARLADGEWHPSMIDELIEQGFTKSTVYRAAERCEKRKASDGAWWWAVSGTPKDTFGQSRWEDGNFRARAGGDSQPGNITPKTPINGSTKPSSHVPTDSDENGSLGPLVEHVPTSQLTSRGQEGRGKLQQRVDALAAMSDEDAEREWQQLERETTGAAA